MGLGRRMARPHEVSTTLAVAGGSDSHVSMTGEPARYPRLKTRESPSKRPLFELVFFRFHTVSTRGGTDDLM
jgi:hypothetical protein